MGGCRARGQWLSAFGLLLLLLGGAVATALPLERGPTGQDSGGLLPLLVSTLTSDCQRELMDQLLPVLVTQTEATQGKRAGLLTFLAWWHGWTSQASSSALVGGDPSEVSRRQESPPLQQPPHRDKKPCKNFFWKTFSSCK